MRVNVLLGERRVGALSEITGQTFFQYDDQFLASGLELSPLHLPLAPGVRPCPLAYLRHLPGLCYDSLPDAWGQRVMERWFRQERQQAAVAPLEQLCFVGDRGVGALRYEPALLADDPLRPALEAALDLRRVELASRALLAGPADRVIPGLANLARNGSAGGARPKLWIGLHDAGAQPEVTAGGGPLPAGFTPWLLKLDLGPRVGTGWREWGRIEHAYALMAAAAGLRTSPTRLILTRGRSGQTRAHFAIARFDRGADGRRIHFHSLAGITEADYNGVIDYREFLSTVMQVCRDHRETVEALRRAAFNVAARVRDDHAKNHGFLFEPATGWRLAPAYDLVYTSPARFPRHAMPLAGNALAPGLEELRRLADEAEIPEREARAVIEQTRAAVRRWPEWAKRAGVPAATAREIAADLPGRQWPGKGRR
ncbi:MAG TPA: type II toxin-antitoxin system HipA family toxin [Opitutaceae bacterium]|nr:type II toxin-antitoxin system HipA family toxin [Opitutaceae bacterium]